MRPITLLFAPLLLAAAEDRPIATKAILEPAEARYRSQVLGDLDHPIADRIVFAGQSIAAKRGAKGELELDLSGTGKFHSYSKSQLVQISVTIPLGEGKKPKAAKLGLLLERQADDSWTYRNASQLSVALGKERLALVDVDGDGSFNTPGVDGMTWSGNTYLFPLPAADERFCTTALDLTGLTMGGLGENFTLLGRPLTTTVAEALPILHDTNRERVKLGLSPRPEDAGLSADLQKHCAYMRLNGKLGHPEESGRPGFSPEGHNSGMRSILSYGTAPAHIAAGMVSTYFHRQDVIRPETRAFGVGFDGGYGGIDGRTVVGSVASFRWPVLCPAPDQSDVPVAFKKEAPDPIPGDDRAGFPVTAYFGSGSARLESYQMVISAAPKTPIECYAYDFKTGASPEFSGYQNCVCLIAKDPLKPATAYTVTMAVDHGGKRWEKTWSFTTSSAVDGRH